MSCTLTREPADTANHSTPFTPDQPFCTFTTLPLVPSPLDHFSSACLLLSLVLIPLDYFSSASLPLLPVLSLLDHFSSVSLIQHPFVSFSLYAVSFHYPLI